MKKTLLYLCLLFATIQGIAQNGITLTETNNKVTVNTSQAPLPVVQKTTVSSKSAKPDTSKRFVIWLEAGNGYFSTDPLVDAPLTGTLSHNSFLLATRLYDTTKDLRITYQPPASGSGTGVNAHHDYLSGRGVKIIPNVYDIVPGDTMAFAIAYQTSPLPAPPYQGKYKVYFFYNNQSAFIPLSANNTMVPNTLIKHCRMHNQEVPAFFSGLPLDLEGDQLDGPYSNYIIFDIPDSVNKDYEKNVFVSLVANPTLEYGNSCSVYAVLTDSADNVIGTDLISGMRFAPAHDPNYLVQMPTCLLLPKKVTPFTYTVHFQNTGGGDADTVKMLVHLPKGMNWTSLNIKEATFAGMDARSTISVSQDQANNILEVKFKPVGGQKLAGTYVDNPAINPLTMGEITFTINSTTATDDTLQAYAEIYFHSVYPSDKANLNPDKYEDPVFTNTATTNYKNCCVNCPPPTPPCKKFIGLCWWWWVIILLAIISLWFILARRRRKKKHQHPYQS